MNTRGALEGCRVLIVEDELAIAMLLESALEDEHCVIVGPYGGVRDALAAARNETLDLAVLDINLAGEMVFPVAEVLAERGVPFLILSGYGDDGTAAQSAALASLRQAVQAGPVGFGVGRVDPVGLTGFARADPGELGELISWHVLHNKLSAKFSAERSQPPRMVGDVSVIRDWLQRPGGRAKLRAMTISRAVPIAIYLSPRVFKSVFGLVLTPSLRAWFSKLMAEHTLNGVGSIALPWSCRS